MQDGKQSSTSAAETFAALWGALNDVLGGAAASALLRRSIKHAASDLSGLEIIRDGFEYGYRVPSAWKNSDVALLKPLMAELTPLLFELSGPVLMSRLQTVPELAKLLASIEEPA